MAFSGLGSGTELDPYQVTSLSEYKEINDNSDNNFFTLMNDIDCGGDDDIDIRLSNGTTLDGGGYKVFNFTFLTGNRYALMVRDNVTIKNIKYTYARTNHQFTFIRQAISTDIVGLTIDNVRVVVDESASVDISQRFIYHDLDPTCSVNNLVVEGIWNYIFQNVACDITDVKVNLTKSISGYLLNDFWFVRDTEAAVTIKNCQIKIKEFNGATNYCCFHYSNVYDGTVLEENFVDGNVIANDFYFCDNLGVNSIVKNNYIIGNYDILRDIGTNELRIFVDGYINYLNNNFFNNYVFAKITKSNQAVTINTRVFGTLSGLHGVVMSNNYYSLIDKAAYFNTIESTGEYEEKTNSEIKQQATFTGWDFSTVWQIDEGNSAPTLINNQPFNFEIGVTPTVTVNSVTRTGSNTFDVSISAENTSDFGVEIWEVGGSLLDTGTSESNSFTLPENRDYDLEVKPYYNDGGQNFQTTFDYFHYFVDQVSVDTINVPTGDFVLELVDGVKAAQNIHGSILYNGFWYGSPRNENFGQEPEQFASFVKVDITDPTNYTLLEIDTTPDVGAKVLFYYFDQIVRIGDHLFSLGKVSPDDVSGVNLSSDYVLVCIDTFDFSYKLFCLPSDLNYASEPLLTDGSSLFISGLGKTIKVDPSQFINAANQFNIQSIFTPLEWSIGVNIYDDTTQGGYIDKSASGYLAIDKGRVHSAQADDLYLYLSYTTSGTEGDYLGWGLNLSHELHVVKKSDMTPAGWCYIPKSTDDMCQTGLYLFFGIEVQQLSGVGDYGEGWGAYAIKKSDVINIDQSGSYVNPVKGLPKLHESDNPPSIQSYASLIFGNYLLDFKTNRKVYILNINDVDNWVESEPVGLRTLKVVDFTLNGGSYSGIINEAAIDPSEWFHAFIWSAPSGVMKFQIPGLSFFAAPTIITNAAIVDGDQATLNGYILNENGQPVTEFGFEYGQVSGALDQSVEVLTLVGKAFSNILTGLDDGTYYFRAYAINSEGTGYGEELSFVIAAGQPVIAGELGVTAIKLGSLDIIKIYKGENEL